MKRGAAQMAGTKWRRTSFEDTPGNVEIAPDDWTLFVTSTAREARNSSSSRRFMIDAVPPAQRQGLLTSQPVGGRFQDPRPVAFNLAGLTKFSRLALRADDLSAAVDTLKRRITSGSRSKGTDSVPAFGRAIFLAGSGRVFDRLGAGQASEALALGFGAVAEKLTSRGLPASAAAIFLIKPVMISLEGLAAMSANRVRQ